MALGLFVAVLSAGAFVTSAQAAKPVKSTNCNVVTAKSFTYCAKNMYGDGLGAVTLVTEGKGKTAVSAWEYAQGSKASLVNNAYDSVLAAQLDNWNTANLGKPVKMCAVVKSVGTDSRLRLMSNNLSVPAGATYQLFETVTIPQSTAYAKYCTPTYVLSTEHMPSTFPHVVMTVNMHENDGTQLATSGPLRLQNVSYELQ